MMNYIEPAIEEIVAEEAVVDSLYFDANGVCA